ncbi:MAG: hypothetical protein TREMPRED_002941 [Tremellales sp. Tagirdzhanova-0007]|nr:MAG: hypothetical protein TREMPRED_002941 [Tremellales sp. Tagirdzhanova-0007]
MPIVADIDDDEGDDGLAARRSHFYMTPAIFQRQMFTMMNPAFRRESRESRQSSSTPGLGFVPKQPRIPNPDTLSGHSNTPSPFLTEVAVVFGLQPSRFSTIEPR